MKCESEHFLHDSAALDAVRVTEAVALGVASLIGRGDEMGADAVAVERMRSALARLNIDGTVVIGEGERDRAPMLYVGEKVGTGYGPRVDIALDPLEGTTICAQGRGGAMSVLAISESGGLLNAPDVYMEKIAVGVDYSTQVVDLDMSPEENLRALASFKRCSVSDLNVAVLDRARHARLIQQIRDAGAKISLIADGDIAAAMLTTSSIDMYIGIGGAPEGVLAAAALLTLGGQICGRLIFDHEDQASRARSMGISNSSKKYSTRELASGSEVIFAATGVTTGELLKGVESIGSTVLTHSIVMSSKHGVIRQISTKHLKSHSR